MKLPCVYIMCNHYKGTLYVGVTSDLVRRVCIHKEGTMPGFTSRYGLNRLVWFEEHDTMDSAISREKKLKRWHRAWKFRLIESINPEWRDLFEELM